MVSIDLKSILNGAWVFFKHFMFYFVFVVSLSAGFALGYHYDTIKNHMHKPYSSDIVKKKDITLAIDERGNLIIFNKNNGNYITYQDSLGYAIFNFYAKKMWGEHSENQK